MRQQWDEHFLRVAEEIATMATCDRKHVGSVLVNSTGKRIVATGFNGSPAGMPHCDDVGHELVPINGRDSCVRTLHAESNAIDYAGRDAAFCTLYVTAKPCYDCAKRIVNVGINRVVYRETYISRNTDKVDELLKQANVELLHLPSKGSSSHE